jgi:LSD1 subclass zinc finger protein
MAIPFACPHCRKLVGVLEGALERPVRCPLCQGVFAAVAPANPVSAIPAARPPVTEPTPHRPGAARDDADPSQTPRPGPRQVPGAGKRLLWKALAASAGGLTVVPSRFLSATGRNASVSEPPSFPAVESRPEGFTRRRTQKILINA